MTYNDNDRSKFNVMEVVHRSYKQRWGSDRGKRGNRGGREWEEEKVAPANWTKCDFAWF